MTNLHFNGKIGLIDGIFHVSLSLIEFIEDDVTIIYSPAINLSGYGYNSKEAKESFKIALYEFFRYTNDKKTFNEVLQDLGWSITGAISNQILQAPTDSELISKNSLYKEIINSKKYTVYNEDVEFAC